MCRASVHIRQMGHRKKNKRMVKSSKKRSLSFWSPVNIENFYSIQLNTGVLRSHSFCERLGTSITHTHSHTHTHTHTHTNIEMLAVAGSSWLGTRFRCLHYIYERNLNFLFHPLFSKRNLTQRSSFCSVLLLQSVN